MERQAEAEAANEVRDLAKPIPSTDYIAMRQAFAAKFGELEDKHIPAKEYIEKKLAELESGEFRAEPLTEIISRDEVDPDTLLPHWDAKGILSLKKGGSRTAMPSGPEQLRLRLTVLQNTLVMIQLRHPGRRELEDVNFALFEKYKEYLLGDYCYGLRSREDSGALAMEPCAQLRARYQEACLQGHGNRRLLLWSRATARLQRAFCQGAQLHHAASSAR